MELDGKNIQVEDDETDPHSWTDEEMVIMKRLEDED